MPPPWPIDLDKFFYSFIDIFFVGGGVLTRVLTRIQRNTGDLSGVNKEPVTPNRAYLDDLLIYII